jgi:molybdate transport system substrate-binding protein
MAAVRVLSAGAAQAVVERIVPVFEREKGHRVQAHFGAVGAMKARVVSGEPFDVVILTGALIDELIALGHVAPGTRANLGKVGTGVAVRADTPLPDVSTAATLRGNLLAAKRVVCPDPATATAGRVVTDALQKLGIGAEVKPRLRFFPNGYAAMRWLAASKGPLELGITQITEIRANAGVTYAGPLPGDLQVKTVYSAGLAARARDAAAARDLIARLTPPAARAALAAAGYELDNP